MGTPKKEVGLEYMIELGIKPVKTSNVLATVIEKNAKKETSEKIYEFMTRRAEEYDNSSNHKDFYALKHESLKLSLSMDGAICGDYFRKVCNWIAEHKEFFNGSILEVGCGCGIFSCFLGRLFPDQQIVSIDICPEAIKLAKQLAERLKVTNIDFVESDVSAITQKFDTVFSSKVLHEIMPRIDGLHYEDLLQITAKRYENACSKSRQEKTPCTDRY